MEKVLRLDNEEFILNQRCVEQKPVRLIACQNVKVIRGNAETITVPVSAEIKHDLPTSFYSTTTQSEGEFYDCECFN